MKFIPIPPPSLHESIDQAIQYPDNMHMILPESCLNQVYWSGYTKKNLKKRSEYRILDNGCAEGKMLGQKDLYKRAAEVYADEVVIPDVMFDAVETLKLVRFFGMRVQYKYRHMAVLQGRTMPEILSLIQEYAQLPYVHVLGIPRHLLTTMDNLNVRVDIAKQIDRIQPNRFHIHMLGTNPVYINEPVIIQRACKETVRSLDTSAPYNYARYGMTLTSTKKIPRPKDWLTYSWDAAELLLCEYNIKIMTAWARGEVPAYEKASSR